MTDTAILLENVGKAYKLFPSKGENLFDALALDRIVPWHHTRYQEFWALRGIDLALAKGQRIGIVGRNGAGKTTLLKLITGNLTPTTGKVKVNGKIQALIDSGTGFHPDFTGRENIRASLTYQGFSAREIERSTEDIADFTELGEFLDRPFRTYSAGMMARLIFATATAIKPEILIIDEILGAGDAYFIGKSSERMKQLVDSGASILLVSHSMEQISRLCESAIWLDRGRVVKSGTSLDVVTAYSQYIRLLEDRRLNARNQKVAAGRRLARESMDSYADTLVLRFVVPEDAVLSLSGARLKRDGELEEECRIGDAQDSDPTQPAFVVLEGGAWSAPREERGVLHRAIRGLPGGTTAGQVAFNLYALYPTVRYSVAVDYGLIGGPAALEVWEGGTLRDRFDLMDSADGHRTADFELAGLGSPVSAAPVVRVPDVEAGDQLPMLTDHEATVPTEVAEAIPTRWPGQGAILIESVRLLGDDGLEHAVYQTAARMVVRVAFRASERGTFPLTPVTVLYRVDGVKVFCHIGERVSLDLEVGDVRCFELDLGSLNLGGGQYAFAVAIYRKLDPVGESIWYDLIDRDYRFEVVGAPPFMGLYEHEGRWRLV